MESDPQSASFPDEARLWKVSILLFSNSEFEVMFRFLDVIL